MLTFFYMLYELIFADDLPKVWMLVYGFIFWRSVRVKPDDGSDIFSVSGDFDLDLILFDFL